MVDDKAYKRYQRRLRRAKGDPKKAVSAGKRYVRDNLTAQERKAAKGNGCVVVALALGAAVAAWKGWGA